MPQLVLAILLISLTLSSCSSCSNGDDTPPRRPTREQFIAHNRYLVHADSLAIAHYSDSLGLNTIPTPSNLWFTIHNPGNGPLIKNGDRVSLEYTISTLLADTFYTSLRDGIKTITAGNCDMTIGIDEALQYLRPGASATIILIPEKAYGYRGDGNAIRRRMILRYDINILTQ